MASSMGSCSCNCSGQDEAITNVGSVHFPDSSTSEYSTVPCTPSTAVSSSSSTSSDMEHAHTDRVTPKRQDSVDDPPKTGSLPSLEVKADGSERNPCNAGRKPVMINALGIPVTLVDSLYSVSVVSEHPIVDVERVERGEGSTLQVHIACIHQEGMLDKLLAVLDLKDAVVHYSQIFCRDNVLSVHLGFEKKNVVSLAGLKRLQVEAEDEHLKEKLLGIVKAGVV